MNLALLPMAPATEGPHTLTTAEMFGSEFFGTMILLLLGGGVVANQLLPKTKGKDTGWLMINFGWGFAVLAGVYASFATGGHINPVVTIALKVADMPLVNSDSYYVSNDWSNVLIYIVAQLLGAFVGAVLMWLTYKKHFDEDAPAAHKLGIFSTGPEIRSYGWNVLTEAIATFVLISWILVSGYTQGVTVGPLAVALVVVVIGSCLGGPTGYAINPARDLGPRIAHAVLPIPGKGSSDWAYSWVPIVGPTIGAIVAALVTPLFFGSGIWG